MDNAVQAMYMAAGTIIALMILSVFVYMFRMGARLGENYEITQETAQVVKFNGQFDAYSKKTLQDTESAHGYSFITKGNTASDIISCANLAMSVNSTSDFDVENHLKVIVKCNDAVYSVYPVEKAPRDTFLINMSFDEAKNKTTFGDDETLEFYKFLKKYNSARTVDIIAGNPQYNSYGETIYEYYFDVDADEDGNAGKGITYSEVTGKANKIVFTMVKTQHYDDGTWAESQ